jgi:mono/diheme cytochrome c family protein
MKAMNKRIISRAVRVVAGPAPSAREKTQNSVLRTVAALVVSAGFAAVAGSALANDVAHGAQLAQQWCMGCHVLPGHPGQTALQGPPSFRELARGGKTSDQLRVFLLKPHGAMPPLTLSRVEIDGLIGYIATLR